MLEKFFDVDSLPLNATTVNLLKLNPNDETFSSHSIEKIIHPDQGFSVEVLKLANSSLYMQQGKVANLRDAITLVGFKTLKNFALMLSSKDSFARITLEATKKHLCELPIVSAIVSEKLAKAANLSNLKEEVFVACLLEGIGKSLFAFKEPFAYNDVLKQQKDNKTLKALENQKFQIDHKLLNAKLFEYWNLPKSILDNIKELPISETSEISKQNKVVLLRELADITAKKMLELPISAEDLELGNRLQIALNIHPSILETLLQKFETEIQQNPFYKLVIGQE